MIMTDLSKIDYFPSLAQMQEENVKLLEQRLTKEDELSDLVDEIESFINRGRKTGILLGSDDERWAAQSLLDYWSIALNRSGHQPPHFILDKYNLDEAPKLEEKDCPYRGLKAFEQTDHNLFFGRTQLIQECLKKLESQPLLVVVGPPNSGKSSLVRAGLLPELNDGKLKGINTTPGSYLQNELNIELEQMKAKQTGKTLVLVIDQFEDLFTLYTDNKIRQKFVDNNLLTLIKQDNKTKIILTMREDFKTNFENLSPSFNNFFKSKDRDQDKKDKKYDYVEVKPLTSSELKEAIEIPAKQKGLQFEGDIVDTLVRDLVGEPMPLPLLQFVLMKLWEKREKNLITEKIYRQVTGTSKHPDQSGVRWTLFHTADDFYKSLPLEEQQTLKRIFLQLLQPSLDSKIKSCRLQRKELYQKSEDKNHQINRVIDELSQLNLLRLTKPKISNDDRISDDDQIEVVHPSLADSWHLLKSWLETEKSEMKDGLALSLKAEDWKRRDRNSDLLLRGKEIDQARQLIKYAGKSQVKYAEESKSPTILEEEFVKKSLARRRTNRLKSTLGSLTILGLIIGLPAYVYYVDLEKQHNLVIQELNKQTKKAEEIQKEYKQRLQELQEIENIRRDAKKLLDVAEQQNKIIVENQQDIAKDLAKILQETEADRRDGEGKLWNFLGGMLIGIVATFGIVFLYEVYRSWRKS